MINEKLNDDCAALIFRKLPVKDLLQVEKVCRQWEYWAGKAFAELKVLTVTDVEARYDDNDLLEITTLAERSGEHLEDLICSLLFCDSRHFFQTVAKNCPNLKYLHLDNDKFDNKVVQILAPELKNLEHICFKSLPGLKDKTLANLFANNRKMISVILMHCKIQGSCLEQISPTTKDLRLVNLGELNVDHIVKCVRNCPLLHTLLLSDLVHLKVADIQPLTEISTAVPNLKQLSLTDASISMDIIHNFRHLQRMFLYDVENVNDAVLKLIGKEYKNLEALGLGRLKSGVISTVTTEGLLHLTRLPKIQELTLSQMDILTPNCIHELARSNMKLRILRLKGNRSLNNRGVLQIIKNFKELTELELIDTSISAQIFQDAFLEIQNQPNRTRKLELILDTAVLRLNFMTMLQFNGHPMLNISRSEGLDYYEFLLIPEPQKEQNSGEVNSCKKDPNTNNILKKLSSFHRKLAKWAWRGYSTVAMLLPSIKPY